ncbi:glycosyltransferase family 9 protein [Bacteriovorax sp. Seq25_V]|uniref:glycosyltransferase family 9 protein n=1 Tax=Bacteriovorax sp. Seq25_V TaxID=1201288 RepID=UPI000389E88D|nr:glycosyltransferase family 9 protein [Bacteriovorax sp. Seq25_V]EQC43251.1 heptosyltransferase domain protein [Bacteriovorax sp. Seq25_V]
MGAKQENKTTETAEKWLSILQLTRIGDILQTAQAVRLLKINHPEIKVQLVARKQFAEPIQFIIDQVFDECITLDLKTAINLRDGVKGSLKNISSQIALINKRPIAASINLSFSKSSTYLHSLIRSEYKLGPFFNEKHEQVIQDKWSQYLFSSVMRGNLNPFNLVDLFAAIIGVKKINTHLNTKEYSKELKNKALIHPFASLDKKRWAESKWTEVIYNLLKSNADLTVYIAGSNGDTPSYEKMTASPILSKFKDRITPLLGKKLTEVYDLVDENFLFIGHDSMLSHLFSFKNVKSLTISLGTVRVQETAPYSLNNYVLAPKTNCYPCFPDTKCSYFQCHADVPFHTAIAMSKQLLTANVIDIEKLRKDVTEFNLNSVDIYRTTTNNLGQLLLKNLLDENKSAKEVFRDFYNVIWSYSFSEVEPTINLPKLSKNATEALSMMPGAAENLYELAEFGKKYSRFILEEISNNSPNIQSIKNYSLKIDEIDRLLDVLITSYPLLSPIVDYAKVAKSNLSGTNIVEMTESAFYVYQEISTSSSIIYDFLNKLNIKKDKTTKLTSSRTDA